MVIPGHTCDIWSQLVTSGHSWSQLSHLVTPMTSGHNWPHLVTPFHSWSQLSHLVTTVQSGHTCPIWSNLWHLVNPGHNCPYRSHLVTPGHNCSIWSHLVTPGHTWSHLVTPNHNWLLLVTTVTSNKVSSIIQKWLYGLKEKENYDPLTCVASPQVKMTLRTGGELWSIDLHIWNQWPQLHICSQYQGNFNSPKMTLRTGGELWSIDLRCFAAGNKVNLSH